MKDVFPFERWKERVEWKALDNNNVRWGDIHLGWQREGVIVCISWLFGCYFILSLFLVFQEMRVLWGKRACWALVCAAS